MILMRLLSTTARCLSGLMIHSAGSNLYNLYFSSLISTLYLALSLTCLLTSVY
jgi:hypothetical protein